MALSLLCSTTNHHSDEEMEGGQEGVEEIVTRDESVFVGLCEANKGRLRAVQLRNKWFTGAESSEFISIIQFKHLS